MKESLFGQFRKIIYNSKDFVVVNFKISSNQDDKKEKLKIEKSVNNINLILNNNDFDLNINYEVEIEAKPSKKYNFSYFVLSKIVVIKSDRESIITYLSSSLFKGISEKSATKLVDNLGIDFINEPSKYKDQIIKLLGNKKGIIFFEQLLNQTSYQLVYKDFVKNNLSIHILNLIGIYFSKENVLEFLQTRLYELIEAFWNINFYDLDNIAKIFYLDYSQEIFLENLTIWLIYQIENRDGSTIIEVRDIFYEIQKHIEITIENLKIILVNLSKKNKIITHLESKSKITLVSTYNKEKFIARKLILMNQTKKIEESNNLLLDDNDNLDSKQQKALVNALNNNVSIITGGPGTGKTFLIDLILKKLINLNSENTIELLAPTGKAAIQISKKTKHNANTIHSFLKYNEYFFEINQYNPSLVKILIIDEFSMIDNHLFYSLLIALPNLRKIIIVGDQNQLPSINSGFLLNDLINSNLFVTTFLTKIFRQKEGSLIAKNSQLINQSKLPKFDNNESILIEFDYEKNVKIEIEKYIKNYLKDNNKNIFDQQILIPQYKGICGIDEINILVQNIINENNEHLFEINNKKYFENDKVIQIENDSKKNVYNGEIGYIDSVIFNNKNSIKPEKIIVKYLDSKYIEYTLGEFNSYTRLAYAISVHKFQGSECKNVLAIFTNTSKFVNKKLFYTAYTRAMNQIVIISNLNILEKIINNDFASNRECNLIYILKELEK